MRSLRVLAGFIISALLVVVSAAPASASVIWGPDTAVENVSLDSYGPATGSLLQNFLLPSLTSWNDGGRGVARLGQTIYYAKEHSGNIYVANAATNADQGVLVNTGFPSLANVVTDGTYIYAVGGQPSHSMVNKYDTAGNLVSTADLGNGSSGGATVQSHGTIADGPLTFTTNPDSTNDPFDVYETDDTLLAAGVTDPPSAGPANVESDLGSEIFGDQLLEYSGSGPFTGPVVVSDSCLCSGGPSGAAPVFASPLVGPLQLNDPVPEPATLILLGSGLAGLAAATRRRRLRR